LTDRLNHRALARNSSALSATNPVAARAILAVLLTGLLLAGCSREAELPAASAEQERLRQLCAQLPSQALAEGLITQSSELIVAGEPAREYCVVTVAIQDSRLRFNTWLPTDGWNQRMAFIGGGGFDGFLLDKEFTLVMSPSILADGYAMVSTNGGYDQPDSVNPLTYFEAEFASDPQALADFMYRSEHTVLPLADDLVEGFYGTAPEYRYFEGCSMGGHDAMLLSQRHPEDFDGIIARAPAGNIVGLLLQFNRVGSYLQNHDAELSAEQREFIASAVMAGCDLRDGLADNMIAWPGACTVDTAAMVCQEGQTSTCLTPAQAGLIEVATTPLDVADHEFTHPGYQFNGINQDAGWGEYIWPKLMGYSVQMLFAQGFVRAFVTEDAEYDTWQWQPEDWLPKLREIAAVYNAVDPDLSAFHAAGGKLILWNGMLDASVSSLETAAYYDDVVEALGQQAADETAELFLSPGVGHCKNGPGPDRADLMAALSTWVETGVAPSQQNLEAYGLGQDGAINRSLPLCKYLAFPRYVDGDPSAASSYRCAEE
jgi:pimeloyl-ACP methyl ester carboxylesterase